MQFRFPFLPAGICLSDGPSDRKLNYRFSFFRSQTCLDNFVLCLYFSLRGDFKWFLHLALCISLYKLKTIKIRKLFFNGNVFSYFSCISVNETNKT